MAGWLPKEAGTMLDGSHFFVLGTEIDAPDAGEGNRACAHGAGFQCDMKVAISQPFASELAGRFAERQHLCMGRRIPQFDGPVSSHRQHFAIGGHDGGANRHLAPRRGGVGLRNGETHGVWQFLLHRAT